MRMIDANALKKSFEEDGHLSSYIEEFIDNAPTIDAEPVRHGQWIFGELGPIGCDVNCSECGWGAKNVDPVLWLDYDGHKHCGCFGAKMDGGKTMKTPDVIKKGLEVW